ncbi:MAG: type VI secretion system transmembrane protein TssO [Marinilabiliaceae bacterium]|nr:type VI secretion system transmembrane protein TssO [Marinilabiliaceae bacterium]
MKHKGSRHYVNRREKLIGYVYVFILFVGMTWSGCWLMLRGVDDLSLWNQKGMAIRKMESQKMFQIQQAQVSIVCDSLYERIRRYSPGIHASYEENDIRFMINDMRRLYQDNQWDNRYKVFDQVGDFYDRWLTDKKELWSRIQNVSQFKANLEACEIGLQKKTEAINGK